MIKSFLLSLLSICFCMQLSAFTGTLTYAVRIGTLNQSYSAKPEVKIDYLIDGQRATFKRETALGEGQCVYYGDSLEIAIEVLGDVKYLHVPPANYGFFQDGQPIVRFAENGKTRLFKGQKCQGYDIVYEGEEGEIVTQAYCYPGMPNLSIDLPMLPSMPIEFELIQGFRSVKYKAVGLKKEKVQDFLFNLGDPSEKVSYSALEEMFSQAVFTDNKLLEDYDMNLVVEGTVSDAVADIGLPLRGIDVKVYFEDKIVAKTKTDETGFYMVKVPLGKIYRVEYGSKSLVKKSLEYDTRGIPYMDQVGGFISSVDISLFRPKSGVDYSILDQPLGKARYDGFTRIIDFDLDYISGRMEAITKELGDNWK